MTVFVVALVAPVVGFAVGVAVTCARTVPVDRNPELLARLDQACASSRDWQQHAHHLAEREQILKTATVRYANAAGYWYRQAEGHRQMLAALGRSVAEGDSIDEAWRRG